MVAACTDQKLSWRSMWRGLMVFSAQLCFADPLFAFTAQSGSTELSSDAWHSQISEPVKGISIQLHPYLRNGGLGLLNTSEHDLIEELKAGRIGFEAAIKQMMHERIGNPLLELRANELVVPSLRLNPALAQPESFGFTLAGTKLCDYE